jgi:hypothetical protein
MAADHERRQASRYYHETLRARIESVHCDTSGQDDRRRQETKRRGDTEYVAKESSEGLRRGGQGEEEWMPRTRCGLPVQDRARVSYAW